MSTIYFQLALYTIASAIGLALLLWAMTTDPLRQRDSAASRLPDGEGF